MTKIIIYGTGENSETYVKQLPNDYEIISFCETNPSKSSFMGLPVYKFSSEVVQECDLIVIASMYYPEILEKLLDEGLQKSKIKIATSHKDDPRFDILMLEVDDILDNLENYKNFKEKIIEIEEFVNSHSPKLFSDRLKNLEYCFNQISIEGSKVEFGVYHGESLLHLSKLTKDPVWGFDSFCGTIGGNIKNLEESPFSQRDTQSTPLAISNDLKDYKYLQIGYFHETLPSWINQNAEESIAFLHYDAGEYEAACFVMERTCPLLTKGSIVVFDEFIPSPIELVASEYEAFMNNFSQDFEIISRSGSSVGIRIK